MSTCVVDVGLVGSGLAVLAELRKPGSFHDKH